MTDTPLPTAPAQVVYTTSPLSAPQVIGFAVALILAGAQHFGLTFLDSPSAQGMLSLAVGWAVGVAGSWLFPSASGRLGLSAPLAWNAPAPQDVPVGASLVNVSGAVGALAGPLQETTVRPANDLQQMLRTEAVAAAVASAAASAIAGRPVPLTVQVTAPGQDNKAVRVSPEEARAAPSVPVDVPPSPAPRAA